MISPLLILPICTFTAEVVAQFKYTVLIMPNGVNLVTGVDFAADQYQSEHSITEPELKVRISQCHKIYLHDTKCKTKCLHYEHQMVQSQFLRQQRISRIYLKRNPIAFDRGFVIFVSHTFSFIISRAQHRRKFIRDTFASIP